MSKEEFLKIQKCVLKVNIHCDGCKHKVKKILQRIDGVFTTDIDAEQGKVTVVGNVDADILMRKLEKSGKRADLWGAQTPNNKNHQQNAANMPNQMKNPQIDTGKTGTNNNKPHNLNQNHKNGNGNTHQAKSGQVQGQQPPAQPHFQPPIKGFPGLKLPLNHQNPNPNPNPNLKVHKFDMNESDDLSDLDDDEYDDDDGDDDDDDDGFEDEFSNLHLPPGNKMKPTMGNTQIPKIMMNGNPQSLMNAQGGGNPAGNGPNAKKGAGAGGGGPVPVQNGKNGNGGNKGNGGGGGGSNQKQGGNGKNGDAKNPGSGGGGGGNNKNGNGGANGNGNHGNGGQKVGGANGMSQNLIGAHGLGGSNLGQMGTMNIPVGEMGNRPIGQMGNLPAVQGLPAAAAAVMNGGGGRYFPGAGPESMPGNPYHQQQQQYMAQIMNQQQQQQHAMGHQPMMYARPPPAVNYAPPYPYPYHPYPPPAPEPYGYFSDENTSSCNIM